MPLRLINTDARNRPSKQVLSFWVNPQDISHYQIELDLEGLGHRQEPSPLAMVGRGSTQHREKHNTTICFYQPPRAACIKYALFNYPSADGKLYLSEA